MMVRTSDIRVSERVCLSSLTLDKFATVYNDLIDEVSLKFCHFCVNLCHTKKVYEQNMSKCNKNTEKKKRTSK